MTKLKVSEIFYSVQGEGISQGTPCIFIRLADCNLICGGHKGKLVESGKASWWCDTEDVWRKGKEMLFEEIRDKIIALLEPFGLSISHLEHHIHIVWTGGEPVMQQTAIIEWLKLFEFTYSFVPYNELETNATIPMTHALLYYMNQINSSPKLANSGMPDNIRINKIALKQVSTHRSGWFKFVVSSEADISEIEESFGNYVSIKNVILMPGVDKLEDLSERTRFIYEMSKKYGYIAITRGHVLAWDKLTGV